MNVVLSHRITLRVKTLTKDSESNDIETWRDWRTIWAQPLSKTSREFYRLSTMNSEITEIFRVRYMHGISSFHQIKFNNQFYDIIGLPVNEEERNKYLLITCKGVG